jgi:autotransporter-associated beta strand protein
LVFNATGYAGDFNATALGDSTAVSILHDGDGTGSFQTLPVGNVVFESGVVPNVTIGRSGGFPFNQAVNKVLQPASLPNANLGLTLTNGNNYGLLVTDALSLGTSAGVTYSVGSASASPLADGLTLSGVISGGMTGAANVVLTKAGAGTLALSGVNTFGGSSSIIDITGGFLSVANDGALGEASNVVRISTNSLTNGFRATESFSTSRTFRLNAASSGIEVSKGKTLTLSSPFTLSADTNALQKNDIGMLVLSANNPTWTGAVTVNQGTLRVTNSGALGTSAGGITINFAAGLELLSLIHI